MTHIIKNHIFNTVDRERKLLFILMSFLVLFSIMYGQWIREAIVSVVERDKIHSQISAITSSLGDLESKYISLKSNVTLETAEDYGFIQTEETKYISKQALTQKLSLNGGI